MSAAEALILKSIRLSANLQKPNGSFPAGHNGPYFDPETSARSTSHWVIANLYAWKRTGETQFKDVARAGIGYLVNIVRQAGDHGVVARETAGKDKTNGLIGQAWIIEALAEAGWFLKHEDALLVAESLFRRHEFDSSANAWFTAPASTSERPEFDRTFNHQLWFAAAGALLVRCGIDVQEPIEHFVNHHVEHVKQYPSGLIHHSNPYFIASDAKQKLKSFARHARVLVNRQKVYMKSIGYHTFNTYAFAMIEGSLPHLHLGEMESVRKAVDFVESKDFQSKIGGSSYSYAYNPPGFEAAYTLKVFKGVTDPFETPLMKPQIELTYDEMSGHFTKNVADVNTSAARVYEAARLLEAE